MGRWIHGEFIGLVEKGHHRAFILIMKRQKQNQRDPLVFPFPEGINLLTIFSDEILIHIFNYLDYTDLITLSLVSNACYHLSNDSSIWRHHYVDRFGYSSTATNDDELLPPSTPSSSYPRLIRSLSSSSSSHSPHIKHRPSLTTDPIPSFTYISSPFIDTIIAKKRDWKNMFMIRHNWFEGQYRILDLPVNTSSSNSYHPPTFSRKHASYTPPTSPLLHYKDLIIRTNSQSTSLEIWRIGDSTLLHEIPIQSGRITSIALDSASNLDDFKTRIAVGLDNGMELFEMVYNYSSTRDKKGKSKAYNSIIEHSAITTYTPTHREPIIAITLNSEFIATCTSEFNIDIFHATNVLTKICTLRSFVAWAPVELCLLPSENETWKLFITFSIPVFNGAWEIGIQQITFINHSLLSTDYYRYQDTPDIQPPANPDFFPSINPFGNDGYSLTRFAAITCLSISPPYILSGHADNSLHLHVIKESGNKKEIKHLTALHGHYSCLSACKVLWRSGEEGRFVSVSREGVVKGWVFNDGRCECVVSLKDDLEAGRRITWVGFDYGKIVTCAYRRSEGNGRVRTFAFFDDRFSG